MTTTPRTHRRAALALLAALTLVIGGCGSDDSGQDTGDQPLDAGGILEDAMALPRNHPARPGITRTHRSPGR